MKKKKQENILPRSDYVFVEMDEVKEVTSGGIILPDVARKAETDEVKVRFGTIRAAGPGLRVDGVVYPCELCVGDKIIVDVDSGEEVEHLGRKYVAVREQNVLAVVE